MSYSIDLWFKQCSDFKEVDVLLQEFKNIAFSDKFKKSLISFSLDKSKEYLESLIKINIYYNHNSKILAVHSPYFFESIFEKIDFKKVCFQNSSDTDYNKNEYGDFEPFITIFEQLENTSLESLFETVKSMEKSSETFEDFSEYSFGEYAHKTLIYKYIFYTFKIDKIIYHPDSLENLGFYTKTYEILPEDFLDFLKTVNTCNHKN